MRQLLFYILVFMMLATQFLCAQPPFAAAPYFPAPRASQAIVADVNADRIPDLISILAEHREISLLQGDGNGGLKPDSTFRTQHEVASILAGRFNADDRPDLLMINYDGPSMSLYLNNAGSFDNAIDYSLKSRPLDFVAGDFNGDSLSDVAVVATGEPQGFVQIFLGRSDGRLQQVQTLRMPAPTAVATGHFDEDQRLDLAVTSYHENIIAVLRGTGNGEFTLLRKAAATTGARQALACDLDRDGKDDLVVVNIFDQVALIRNLGDARFEAPYLMQFIQIQGRAIVAQEASRNPLLVVSDSYDSIVLIRWAQSVYSRRSFLFEGTGAIASADWDGDGFPELAANVLDYNSAVAHMVLIHVSASGLRLPSHKNFFSTNATDLNQDGHLDLLGRDFVQLGRGNGTFVKQTFSFDPGITLIPLHLNADAAPDLAILRNGPASFRINNGRGQFGPERALAPGKNLTSIIEGDLNHDGRKDLIVMDDYRVYSMLNKGSGVFSIPSLITSSLCSEAPLLADVDDDGNLDLLDTCFSALQLFRGNPDGTFQRALRWTPDPELLGLRVAAHDWSGDGKSDLMLFNYNGTAKLLLGLGEAKFSSGQSYAAPGNPNVPLIGDFNGDGADDLAVVGEDSALAVYLAQPGVTSQPLAPPIYFGAGIHIFGLGMTGDFNEDGRLDIVAAGRYPDKTILFFNQL